MAFEADCDVSTVLGEIRVTRTARFFVPEVIRPAYCPRPRPCLCSGEALPREDAIHPTTRQTGIL
jgi:hypothetical protein